GASRCLIPRAWKRSRANASGASRLKRPNCFDKSSVLKGLRPSALTGLGARHLADLVHADPRHSCGPPIADGRSRGTVPQFYQFVVLLKLLAQICERLRVSPETLSSS